MKPRQGMVLVCVLVCLGIAATITGLTVQSSLRARQQMKRHWQLEQTRVLLDASIRHVRVRSSSDTDQWDAPWDVSDAFDKYVVAKVTVTPEPGGESSFRVTAEIQSEGQTPTVTRRSRTITLARSGVPTTKSKPSTKTTPEQDN